MDPGIQSSFFQIRHRGVRLLCQRRSKIPGDHHIYIVFPGTDFRYPLQIYRIKIILQKVLHQHSDAEPDHIGLLRGHPFPDLFRKHLRMFPKAFRRQLIAGRPVVDIRQEPVQLLQALGRIPYFRQNKGVKLILFKSLVRKLPEERFDVFPFFQFLRVFPKRRSPYPVDLFRRLFVPDVWRGGAV